MRRSIVALLSVLVPAQVFAEEGAPLALTEVLRSTLATHPKLAEARARIDEVRGERLAYQQAFEPQIVGGALALPAGFYEYWQMAAAIEQTLPVLGVKMEGGYRLARGNIPPYYGERVTRDGGELFAKVTLPVLANRSIDKDRAAIRKATIEIAARDAEGAQTWLQVARETSIAYWRWVAAGQRLRVAIELYRIAGERARRMDAQAEQGALPRITKVDNNRVLLARKSTILKLEAEFVKAQAELSLYYRDRRSLKPLWVPLDQVPIVMQVAPPTVASSPAVELEDAFRQRPELRVLRARQEQASVDLELAANQALPKLDVAAFAARDLGEGPESLGQVDVGMGLELSIPLLRRQARGERRSVRAKLASIAAKRRALRDSIAADLRQAAEVADLARRRFELAREQLEAAQRLADAERQRLAEGASDILVVNLRELDVASAANDTIDAAFDANRAAAELVFARGTTKTR